MADNIPVEVAYATADQQVVITASLKPDSTANVAIEQSGLLQQFPEIDLTINKVGIFGVLCPLDRTVTAGDRVEIYRPLLIDPKEARRVRAAQSAKGRS